MDGPEKVPGDAEFAVALSDQARRILRDIGNTAGWLLETGLSREVSEHAQLLVKLSGTLAGVAHQHDVVMARVRRAESVGRPTDASECPGFQLARQDLICGLCGCALEEHGVASDARPVCVPYVFPDASKVPLKHAHTPTRRRSDPVHRTPPARRDVHVLPGRAGARVMWVNDEHEPRWEGPSPEWCDEPAYGEGAQQHFVVACNRMLLPDWKHCPNAANHVVPPDA
jgi:hypothetical protein